MMDGKLAKSWMGWLILCCFALLVLACTRSDSDGRPAAASDLDADEMRIAMVEAIRTTDSLDRVRRTVELIDGFDDDNFQGALDAYEDNLRYVEPEEIRPFANAWARRDPAAALDQILEWQIPRVKNAAVNEVVYWWVRSGRGAEARAYVDAARAAGYSEIRSPVKSMILAVVKALAAGGDFDELTSLLASLPNDGDRELWLTEAMLEVNRTGSLTTFKLWVDDIPWDVGDGLKLSLLKRGLDVESQMDGPLAGQWYLEVEPYVDPEDVMPMAVAGWANKDPVAVLEWLAERDRTPIRDRLMRLTAVGWLKRDPEAAEAWLESRLDDELMRERMLFVLAHHKRSTDIEAAVGLASEIPDEVERARALQQILLVWLRDDAKSAEAYMDSGKIPAPIVEEIRKKRGAMRVERRRIAPPEDPGA